MKKIKAKLISYGSDDYHYYYYTNFKQKFILNQTYIFVYDKNDDLYVCNKWVFYLDKNFKLKPYSIISVKNETPIFEITNPLLKELLK